MATNKLTEVAGLVAQAVMGAKVKDKDGNAKTVKPTGDDNLLDLTDIVAGGSTGGNAGGTTGGNISTPVSQLPSTVNLFSGSAVGNILLSGPTPNYDNVQDGLLITLSNKTLAAPNISFGGVYSIPLGYGQVRMNLSSIGLKGIKVPKEELIMNNSFDVSDQLSQYVGKVVQGQYNSSDGWININHNYSFSIVSFEGSSIKILPNENINLSLTVHVTEKSSNNVDNAKFPIPVIRVNTYKN